MPSLQTDIIGRVKRLPLDPSEKSALLPLFEAISNGLHAIDDCFKNNASKEGKIVIEVLREESDENESRVIGFIITDNGIGLNKKNFESFCKPDSLYKIERGGKGVGRLGWLKIFKDIRIDSCFLNEDENQCNRSFLFKLAENNQIEEIKEGKILYEKTGTKVTLKNFKEGFQQRCPVKTEIIQQRIISHYLPLFATKNTPKLILIDEGKQINLLSVFDDLTTHSSEDEISIKLDEKEIKLNVRHLKLKKEIRSGVKSQKYNYLYMAAHSRVAYEKSLDDYLGIKLLKDDKVYIGCVSGEYLDLKINQERTGFNCSNETIDTIVRTVSNCIKKYLFEDIEIAKEGKKKRLLELIDEYPTFLYLKQNIDDFVDKLPPNATLKKDIYAVMCKDRYEKTHEFRKIKENIQKASSYTQDAKKLVEKYKEYVDENKKGVLAEYILSRKAIIEILDHYLELTDNDKYQKEEVIHQLIVPMKTDSDKLSIDDHNLWLLDDRLAFFGFFASDKPFKDYTDCDSSKRPDIAFIYDRCLAWSELENGNKIVLVEFKRPSRNDYDDSNNPVRQLINYIDILRKSDSKLKDCKGKSLSQSLKNASFHCYIIADIEDSLEQVIQGMNFHQTSDGKGLVGFLRNPDAYVEIIPYEKLVSDAKKRNSIFLKKLGLNN